MIFFNFLKRSIALLLWGFCFLSNVIYMLYVISIWFTLTTLVFEFVTLRYETICIGLRHFNVPSHYKNYLHTSAHLQLQKSSFSNESINLTSHFTSTHCLYILCVFESLSFGPVIWTIITTRIQTRTKNAGNYWTKKPYGNNAMFLLKKWEKILSFLCR